MMSVKARFLLRLGNQFEQAGNEGNLSRDVPLFHPMHLSLPKHIYALISLERVPCGLERKEAHSWFDQPFDEPVILFDKIVEVFALPQFTRSGKIL
jgi:hypothetical protein